jgi:hypothetical protein
VQTSTNTTADGTFEAKGGSGGHKIHLPTLSISPLPSAPGHVNLPLTPRPSGHIFPGVLNNPHGSQPQ